MSEIVGPMQVKISQIADLLDIPPASAAALLRYTQWSQEKLTDRFWANSAKLMDEAGIVLWKKSAEISTLGTGTSQSASSSTPGSQEGAEVIGLQSKTPKLSSVNMALGLPAGYCGIEMSSSSSSSPITCRICFVEVDAKEAMASPCGHSFCLMCYQEYLSTKVGEGPSVVFTQCPEHKCNCLVPPEVWLRSLGAESSSSTLGAQVDESTWGGGAAVGTNGKALLEKYSRMILEQFVSSSKQMRWCPAPGCERIVMAGAGVANVKCGPGGCGNAFCFKCGEEAHQPATCDELVMWTEKCQNESETANWILANTKRCPKCTTRIEKNQGCNHMVSPILCVCVCVFFFVWLLRSPIHGISFFVSFIYVLSPTQITTTV
jgi:ariadne-1